MTIVPLSIPYGEDTHFRLVNINLESDPVVVHFHRGHFEEGATPTETVYQEVEAPAGWIQRQEINTANISGSITDLSAVAAAVELSLQANA